MRTPHNERLSADIVEDGPERTCILSGRRAAREALIRLAVSPPDAAGHCALLPDVLARAPGRGAWIGVDRAELESSLARGKLKAALARAFKGGSIAIPDDLGARIEAALLRAVTDRLGLEWRAGHLLLGTERIAEQARMGRIAFLGHARDAGEDGNRRLDQAWRVGEDCVGSGRGGMILPLDRAALSVALGRDNVVHLALTDRLAATRVAQALERLTRFAKSGGIGPASAEGRIHAAAADAPQAVDTVYENAAPATGAETKDCSIP
ncbi:MAG: DUF448 domain-containing protein [Sphingomonadales bacterium]|nr:DUF448 domain-containing protein [Sphingomonadales bacterium]